LKAVKLKNAPLKEAIFELYWHLPLDQTGFPTDSEFDIALGKFASKIQNSFPVHKRLFPPGTNLKIYPKPSHQFWTRELTWPVVQLGPGILSVNETEKNYSWKDNFRANIDTAINTLLGSYAEELKFTKIRLTYIDAIDYSDEQESAAEFVSKNLLTSIVTKYELPGVKRNVQIGQSSALDNGTLFHFNIQNGINNSTESPSIIWTTALEKSDEIKKESLLDWLDFAHQIASDSFVNTLNPDFYARLNR